MQAEIEETHGDPGSKFHRNLFLYVFLFFARTVLLLRRHRKEINDQETYCCIQAERALLEAIGGDCDTAIGGLAKLSNNKIFLRSELFSNDGKKKFQFQSSGHFREAKEIGYKVGKELLKKAGPDFTTQGI